MSLKYQLAECNSRDYALHNPEALVLERMKGDSGFQELQQLFLRPLPESKPL